MNGERVHAILSSFTDRGGEEESLCRVTYGLVSKEYAVWGPGLTSKRPKAGNDLQNQSRSPETKDQGVKFDYNYLKCVWITSFLFRLGMASTIPQARPPIS